MTIAKGQPWGRPGPLDPDQQTATGDAELARLVRSTVLGDTVVGGTQPDDTGQDDPAPAAVGLSGGDLHTTLGGGARRPTDPDAWRFPIDAIIVRMEGSSDARHQLVAVAHVVAFRCSDDSGVLARLASIAGRRHRSELRRMPWFVEETLVVANAAFVGNWNIAPRSHPNDGRLHVTRGSLPQRDQRQLDGRLRTGTHLPHPDLARSRPKSVDSGAGPWHLFIDGVDHGRTDRFSVEIVPDAFTVVA